MNEYSFEKTFKYSNDQTFRYNSSRKLIKINVINNISHQNLKIHFIPLIT